MAISYDDTLRNTRMDAITTRAGNAALIRIYSGTRPTNGGAEGTLLAELTCDTPFAAGASAGVLTLGTITEDSSANASGVASWFRIYNAGATNIVCDGDVGVAGSGADLILDSTSITETQTVSIDTFVITEGNDY
jgi:hypothetical protein